jgi:predicted phosphodiesterase
LTRLLGLSGVVGGEGVGEEEEEEEEEWEKKRRRRRRRGCVLDCSLFAGHTHRRIVKKATGIKRKSPGECVISWGPKKKLFLFCREGAAAPQL